MNIPRSKTQKGTKNWLLWGNHCHGNKGKTWKNCKSYLDFEAI